MTPLNIRRLEMLAALSSAACVICPHDWLATKRIVDLAVNVESDDVLNPIEFRAAADSIIQSLHSPKPHREGYYIGAINALGRFVNALEATRDPLDPELVEARRCRLCAHRLGAQDPGTVCGPCKHV